MSHPDYAHIGKPEDRLIEECSELIKAICKAKRFGLSNYSPRTGKVNKDWIFEEMRDVEKAIENYRKEIEKPLTEGK